jgi:hypothetical protein
VASEDLRGLGPNESEPVLVEWHWHYHLPSLTGWAFVGALLVLVKENRNRSAWLILIPFLLLGEVAWPCAVRLFSLPSSVEEQYGLPLQLFLVAWSAIWLLSPWLARRRPVTAFLLVVVFAAMVGIGGQFGVFHRLYFAFELSMYLTAALALPAAFVISRWSCRKHFRPKRFIAWLVPWLILGVIAGETSWILNLLGRSPQGWWVPAFALLLRVWIFAICMAGILYLLNLPFMYLAFHCPLYRDRFHKLLRLPLE